MQEAADDPSRATAQGIDAEKVAWGGCSGRLRRRRGATEEVSGHAAAAGGSGCVNCQLRRGGQESGVEPASITGEMCVATRGRSSAWRRRGWLFATCRPASPQHVPKRLSSSDDSPSKLKGLQLHAAGRLPPDPCEAGNDRAPCRVKRRELSLVRCLRCGTPPSSQPLLSSTIKCRANGAMRQALLHFLPAPPLRAACDWARRLLNSRQFRDSCRTGLLLLSLFVMCGAHAA